MVHWQAGDRPVPDQQVTVSGESALWVDPAEIPADDDIGKLGRALIEVAGTPNIRRTRRSRTGLAAREDGRRRAAGLRLPRVVLAGRRR